MICQRRIISGDIALSSAWSINGIDDNWPQENTMAGNVFEKADSMIKAIRYVAVGIALAIVAVFVMYCVSLTAWRLASLLWRAVFGHPWGV